MNQLGITDFPVDLFFQIFDLNKSEVIDLKVSCRLFLVLTIAEHYLWF